MVFLKSILDGNKHIEAKSYEKEKRRGFKAK
jgi:hypothetical protein